MNKFYFPVLISLFLLSCALSQVNNGSGSSGGGGGFEPPVLYGVFVTTNGNDTNSGTNQSVPLRTFKAAISNALANGLTNIYVASGSYKPGVGLNGSHIGLFITNSGLNFSGGWDSNFQFIASFSVLDGNFTLDHVVYAKNVSNMAFQGLIVRNGYTIGNDTTNTNGAGMYLSNLTECLFTNIIVSSNYALGDGGGIWFCGVSNTFYADILSNYANYPGPYYGFGGGIYVGPGSFYNRFRGEIAYNVALGGGGMFFGTNSGNNEITGIIEQNVACGLEGGGGITFFFSHSNYVEGLINGNWTTDISGPMDYAGGFFINHGSWNTIVGTICSNHGYSGSGGCVYYGSNNTVRAFIYDNTNAGYGGGLFIYYSVNATISGLFLRNIGPWWYSNGGGIAFYYSSAVLTNAIITENIGGSSGGIIVAGSTVVTNGSYIYNNFPNDYY